MSEQHSNLAFEDGITGEPSELWRLHATRKTPATLKDIPHINWFATEDAASRHAAWINDGRGQVLAIDKYVKADQLTAAQQRVAELEQKAAEDAGMIHMLNGLRQASDDAMFAAQAESKAHCDYAYPKIEQLEADNARLQAAIQELIKTLRVNCPRGNAVADCYDIPTYTGEP